MARKFVVIINRGSGDKLGGEREKRIRSAFAAMDHPVDMEIIDPRQGIERAVSAAMVLRPDVIVAAGGDGTISGIAEILCGSKITLGIIPSGTFNYFARSVNLPLDIDEAVRVLIEGSERPLDVAQINDHLFLNNTSIGAYSAILKTREGIYARWGRSRIAAYWSVIRTLATFRAPLNLKVTLDGKKRQYRTPLVFVMNNAFQLDQMGLPGREMIESGQMVMLVAPHTNRWGLFKHALALSLGHAREKVDYEIHGANEIHIDMQRGRRAVARDGEITRMQGPFHLKILRGALRLIVPQTATTEAR